MQAAAMEIKVGFAPEHTHDLESFYGDVTACIVCITPDMARVMLSHNTKNRKLNQNHVRRLQAAMEAGEWWMNGEAIIFGQDGTLLNGQHRLFAIIASGVSVDVLVVRGINRQAFRTLDGGRVRTTGEVLAMVGEKNANMVAAAVQALISFVDVGGTVFSSGSHGRKATPTLTETVLRVHSRIRESVFAMRRNTLFRNQHGCLLHYLFSIVDAAKAAEFASVLADGHADIGRPFVVLRETLLRTPLRTDLRRAYCAKSIKAFNAEMLGERPKMFKFLSGEDFPTIYGLDYEKLAESVG